MCWGRQAECACVRVCGVWLCVPDAGPLGLTRSPPAPTSLLTAVFQGRSLALAGWVSLVPPGRVFSLSPFLLFLPRASVCTRACAHGGVVFCPAPKLSPSLPSPVFLPPCLWLPRQGVLGEVLVGGDGRWGRPTLDPSNSVTTSLLAGEGSPGALFSARPAHRPRSRTLSSSQPECVCGGGRHPLLKHKHLSPHPLPCPPPQRQPQSTISWSLGKQLRGEGGGSSQTLGRQWACPGVPLLLGLSRGDRLPGTGVSSLPA